MNITMVMVLYNQELEQSKTFQTLCNTLFQRENWQETFQVMVYDNSATPHEVPAAYKDVITYEHDARNLGIATAYNYAFAHAQQSESDWLLLLDHDTELTEAYIDAVFAVEDMRTSQIAAIVPQIMCKKTMISPVYTESVRPLQGDKPNAGLQEYPIMAINSAALISMKFLARVGGFNVEFPLDFLDHWLFYEVENQGYRTYVMDVSLEHELSVMNYNTVSLQRYKSILQSEIHFYKKYKQSLLPRYKKQLLLRTMKQLLLVKNKKIALHTMRKLWTV